MCVIWPTNVLAVPVDRPGTEVADRLIAIFSNTGHRITALYAVVVKMVRVVDVHTHTHTRAVWCCGSIGPDKDDF